MYDTSDEAKFVVDKHLKERKCCHIDDVSSQINSDDSVDDEDWVDYWPVEAIEAGYGKKLSGDINLSAQPQTITLSAQPQTITAASETNPAWHSAAQGRLTSPRYLTVPGNMNDNGYSGVPTDSVNNTANILEDIHSGRDSQARGDRSICTPMQITRI